MESVEKQPVKIFLKKHWRIIKPLLLTIAVIATMLAVIFFTYRYFTCIDGSIPADKIVDENAIKKSDWLGFWGCVLGVFSTIVFSLLSWKQNKTLKRINDNNQAKEYELSEMRYKSECYSLIALKHLCFFKNGDNKESISLGFDDTGKISPDNLFVFKLCVRFREDDENFADAYSLINTRTPIENTRSTTGFGSACQVTLQVEQQQYQRAFEYIIQHINNKDPYVIVNIDCSINNPMRVSTMISGEYSLKLVELLQGENGCASRKEKALFGIVGSFTKTSSYKYTSIVESE